MSSEHLKPGMTEMMQRVVAQTEQKALWKDKDDPIKVADMIAEETEELRGALQESMLTGDVFNVASEIGDILYLALKFCSLVGISPEDAVQIKILRNDLKYPNDLNSYGDYFEQRQQSRDFWIEMGGDVAFSHAYLEIFSKIGLNGNGYK